jgi:hypothetical protein
MINIDEFCPIVTQPLVSTPDYPHTYNCNSIGKYARLITYNCHKSLQVPVFTPHTTIAPCWAPLAMDLERKGREWALKRKTQSQHKICKQGGGWGSERGLRPRMPSSLSIYWVAVYSYWSWSICGLIVNFWAKQDICLNFCALKNSTYTTECRNNHACKAFMVLRTMLGGFCLQSHIPWPDTWSSKQSGRKFMNFWYSLHHVVSNMSPFLFL